MTVLGYHTAAELTDLTAAYDYQEAQLAAAVNQAMSDGTWAAQDPNGWASFANDFASWKSAYDPVRASVQPIVDTPTLSDLNPSNVEAFYQKLASAFAPAIDLDRRLRQGPAAALAPSYADNPQPKAPDTDLNVFNSIGAAQNAVKGAAASAWNSTVGAVPWYVWAGAALLGLGVVGNALRR